jgi:hypothetical protein
METNTIEERENRDSDLSSETEENIGKMTLENENLNTIEV